MKSKVSFVPLLELIYLLITNSVAFACGAIYLGAPVNPILVSTFALLVFGIYGLNRYTDVEDIINSPEKMLFFKSNKLVFASIILSFVISISVLVVNELFTLYHTILISAGVVYSFRMIPVFTKKNRLIFVRLKDIPFAKSVVVSLLFGTAYFMITISVYQITKVDVIEFVLVIISFILAVFMNTNFADIRDEKGDKAVGVPTIPVILGVKNTYIYAMVIPGFIWFLFISIMLYMKIIAVPIMVFFVANLLFPLFYIVLYNFSLFFKKNIQPVADGCVVLYGVGLLVLAYLF